MKKLFRRNRLKYSELEKELKGQSKLDLVDELIWLKTKSKTTYIRNVVLAVIVMMLFVGLTNVIRLQNQATHIIKNANELNEFTQRTTIFIGIIVVVIVAIAMIVTHIDRKRRFRIESLEHYLYKK